MANHLQHAQDKPSFFRKIGTIGFHWLAGPLCIWFACSLLLPVLFGFFGKSDQYVQYVLWVEHIEANASAWVSPQIGFDPDPLLATAWPYKVARNVGNSLISADQKGLVISDQQSYEDRSIERTNQKFIESGNEAPAETGGEKAIFAKIGSFFHDRFWDVNRTWIATFLCRLIYVAEFLLVSIVWFYCAWKIGSYLVRVKDENGQPHLQHRYKFWANSFVHLVKYLPYALALPIPVPGLVTAIVFILPLPFCLAMARSHYITRI